MPQNVGNGNADEKCEDGREGGDQSKAGAPHAMAKVRGAAASKIVTTFTRWWLSPIAPMS